MTRLPPAPGTDPLTGAPLPRAVMEALAARAAGDAAPPSEEPPAPPAPDPAPPAPAPDDAPPSPPAPDAPSAPAPCAPRAPLAMAPPGTAVVLFASPVDMRVEGARARWSVFLAQARALEMLGLAAVHEGPVALAVAVPAALEGDPLAWEASVEDRTNVWRPTDRVEAEEAAARTAALLRADPRTGRPDGPAGWRCLLRVAQRMKCPADILGDGIS